jgi:hypothetical protein
VSPKERADFRRGFVGSVNRPRLVIAGLEAAIVDDAAAAAARALDVEFVAAEAATPPFLK